MGTLHASSPAPTGDRWARFAMGAKRHAWLLPILVVAAWLRLAGLGSGHLYGDEAEYAIVARYLSRDPFFLAYPGLEGFGAQPFVSQPPLILYLMALSMTLLGPTDLAALLPSALLGVGTVAALYGLGLRLGGRFVGLAAAALLAALPFHVEMSRNAMLDTGLVLFLVLDAYFCVRWLQTRTRGAAVGVGVMTAGAALAKLPGALAGPVVLLVLLLGLAVTLAARGRSDRPASDARTTLQHAGWGALPVAIGAVLYLGLLAYLNALTNLWVKLIWQLGRVDVGQARFVEATAVHREATWYFTSAQFGFRELLGGVVFALALVGLVVALLRFARGWRREPEQLVAPLFVFVLLAFFMWSDRKEGFYLLPFAPFAALFVAQAADGLRRLLAWGGLRAGDHVGARMAPVGLAVGILLVAVPAYGAATESVEDFALGQTEERYFGYGTREAAAFIHARDPDAAQYGTLLGRFTLHWYDEQTTYHWYVDHSYLEAKIQSGELKYIVYDDYLNLAFDREYMRDLIDRYHGEAVATFKEGWGQVIVFELHPRPAA